jgi:hypothetical protein
LENVTDTVWSNVRVLGSAKDEYSCQPYIFFQVGLGTFLVSPL